MVLEILYFWLLLGLPYPPLLLPPHELSPYPYWSYGATDSLCQYPPAYTTPLIPTMPYEYPNYNVQTISEKR